MVKYVYLSMITKPRPHQPPANASGPSPTNDVTGQSVNVDLFWTGGDPDGDAVPYGIYLEAGDDTRDPLTCDDRTAPSCGRGCLGRIVSSVKQLIRQAARGYDSLS